MAELSKAKPLPAKAGPSDQADRVTVYNSNSLIKRPLQLLGSIVGEFHRGHELAWRLFLRNIRAMYRQTALGLFWIFLPPIANTAIWIFLRSQNVFSIEGTEGVDTTVYILTGMILWQSFIDAFNMPLQTLNRNKNMISKLNFPREALLAVGFGEVLFNLAVRLLLLIPAFIWFGVPLQSTVVLAPIAVVGIVFFGMALGLFIMPIGSLYQDVGRFLTMFLPFWMIITPIIYVTDNPWLVWLNPASPLLLLARDWLLVGSASHLTIGLCYLIASIPLAVVGLMLYRIAMPILVERMQA